MLYFGTDTPDGRVSANQWRAFVDRDIAPQFPVGFTVSKADGAYLMANGKTIREPTHVLTVVYPHGEETTVTAKIHRIVDDYKRSFRQESVLRVIDRVKATL
jgi:hypothetical protein